MGETNIEWAEFTYNPWIGCVKVSAACDNCYAAAWAKRTGESRLFEGDPPRLISKISWNKPYKWNRQAEEAGKRQRVFCASLADVFDDRVPWQWREDLWTVVSETTWLDWLILTKRPENMAAMLPENFPRGMGHVWLGVTVEDKDTFTKRIPILREIPAAHKFISCEPLLGNIPTTQVSIRKLKDFDVVIVGGETGANARYMEPVWALRILWQCQKAGTPFFMKQMSKRKDIPRELRVREFPGYGAGEE